MKKYLLIFAIILLYDSSKAQTTTSTIAEARKIAAGRAVTDRKSTRLNSSHS